MQQMFCSKPVSSTTTSYDHSAFTRVHELFLSGLFNVCLPSSYFKAPISVLHIKMSFFLLPISLTLKPLWITEMRMGNEVKIVTN